MVAHVCPLVAQNLDMTIIQRDWPRTRFACQTVDIITQRYGRYYGLSLRLGSVLLVLVVDFLLKTSPQRYVKFMFTSTGFKAI